MTNNDIFKKLRVALQLLDEQIVTILELVDFRISKGELGNIFRKEDHPNYMECGDQLLRNFLNGLIIHLRGTKEEPKNPIEVLDQIAKSKIPLANENFSTEKKKEFKKEFSSENKPKKDFSKKKFVEKKKITTKLNFKDVKFSNGKKPKE